MWLPRSRYRRHVATTLYHNFYQARLWVPLSFSRFYPAVPHSLHEVGGQLGCPWHLHHAHSSLPLSSLSLSSFHSLVRSPLSLTHLLSFPALPHLFFLSSPSLCFWLFFFFYDGKSPVYTQKNEAGIENLQALVAQLQQLLFCDQSDFMRTFCPELLCNTQEVR